MTRTSLPVDLPLPGRAPDLEAVSLATVQALMDTIACLERRLTALEELTHLHRARTPSRDLHIDY